MDGCECECEGNEMREIELNWRGWIDAMRMKNLNSATTSNE